MERALDQRLESLAGSQHLFAGSGIGYGRLRAEPHFPFRITLELGEVHALAAELEPDGATSAAGGDAAQSVNHRAKLHASSPAPSKV